MDALRSLLENRKALKITSDCCLGNCTFWLQIVSKNTDHIFDESLFLINQAKYFMLFIFNLLFRFFFFVFSLVIRLLNYLRSIQFNHTNGFYRLVTTMTNGAHPSEAIRSIYRGIISSGNDALIHIACMERTNLAESKSWPFAPLSDYRLKITKIILTMNTPDILDVDV